MKGPGAPAWTSRAKGNGALNDFTIVTRMVCKKAQCSIIPPRMAALEERVKKTVYKQDHMVDNKVSVNRCSCNGLLG